MCCTRLPENTGRKKLPKIDIWAPSHNFSDCIFATKESIDNRKKMLISNTSSTCPHNTVRYCSITKSAPLLDEDFGRLTAEISSGVRDTPANVNGFRVLASLLRRGRSPEANQTLHDVCPSRGLLHYIYIFGGSCPWRNFARCIVHFAFKSCVLLYWHRYCTALEQWPSAKLRGVVQGMELRNFRRGRHLYSAGRPPRWASAHILVIFVKLLDSNYFELC